MRSLKEQASGTSNCRSSRPTGGESAWPDSTKSRPFRRLSIRLHLFVVLCFASTTSAVTFIGVAASDEVKFHSADVGADKRSCHQLRSLARALRPSLYDRPPDPTPRVERRCMLNQPPPTYLPSKSTYVLYNDQHLGQIPMTASLNEITVITAFNND